MIDECLNEQAALLIQGLEAFEAGSTLGIRRRTTEHREKGLRQKRFAIEPAELRG
jgi:hypothetical protein